MSVNKKPIDWAGLGWLFLFFWYFSGVVQLLILSSGTSGFSGFRNATIFSLLWLIPVLLMPRWTKTVAAVIGLALWACSLVSLGYFGVYGQEFSQSVIFIMFESNTAEAFEYLDQYSSTWLLAGMALYTAVGYLLWRRLRPVRLPAYSVIPLSIVLFVAILGYPLHKHMVRGQMAFPQALDKLEERMQAAVPWQLVFGYRQYRKQLANMENLLEKNAALPPLQNLIDRSGDMPRTLVLVIGESTNRAHMSLYGYERSTTPKLDALKQKGELAVFDNVVAPRPYTIEAMQQILTFADQEQPDRFLTDPSLMNLMKQAGYKTFWITNHQTMTKRNTMLTTFSQQTDEQFYLNNQRNQNASQYDEVVLEPFQTVLKDTAPRKFIVIHLLGTHMSYKYRYPEAYAVFNDRTHVPAVLDNDEVELYNSYDNAVLYNDHVVSSLIESFAQNGDNGLVVYFADHGEEVFDQLPHDRLGRNENDPTPGMYTVPFMVWSSPQWRQSHPLDFDALTERQYSTAHFIHTWSDLAGLEYDRFEPRKSLINPAFQTGTRWIGDPYAKNALRDFDQMGKEHRIAENQ